MIVGYGISVSGSRDGADYVLNIEEELKGRNGDLAEELDKWGLTLEVRTVRGGQEAIQYLREAQNGKERIPGALIADLTFGCFTGWEVLTWASKQVGLRPVALIARVSEGDTDGIKLAQRLGVHRCVSSSEELVSALRVLEDFWSACVG